MPESKYTLVLIRHGESEWNNLNKFTGWHDVPLSEVGVQEATASGKLLASEGFQFDAVYTSVLMRAIKTAWICMEQTKQMWLPVTNAWQLNERHYGGLTGLNKKETVEKCGEEQVLIWRRSYDIPPPDVETDSPYYPGNDRRYKDLKPEQIPKAESLKLTLERVLPYWESDIIPAMKAGKRLLIAAHGNSLRALVKHLDNIPDETITGLNIPTGIPLIYELDENFKPIPSVDAVAPLTGRYLGNKDEVEARIKGAASTGGKH